VKTQDSLEKNTPSLAPCLWAILAKWLHIGVLQKIQEKINLQPILNKNSPPTHMESKFDVLEVHLFKRKN
jgi:hypothetical protein